MTRPYSVVITTSLIRTNPYNDTGVETHNNVYRYTTDISCHAYNVPPMTLVHSVSRTRIHIIPKGDESSNIRNIPPEATP